MAEKRQELSQTTTQQIMNKELSFVLVILGIINILVLLKPAAVKAYCQHRFENFNHKKTNFYNSLPKDQEPNAWQIKTDYEVAYQFVYIDCMQELGETP